MNQCVDWQVITGDCLEVMRGMDAGSVDAVITDPPYGMRKAAWDMDIVPVDSWLPIARGMGKTAVFTGVRGTFDYPKPDWIMAWVRLGSTQRNGKYQGFNNWEPILMYGLDRLANDVINLPNLPDDDAKEHPTPKPLKLMKALIERLTHPGDLILDPFCGSGTTGVACIQTGRRFIGIEIDPTYADIARARCEKAAEQARQLELVL